MMPLPMTTPTPLEAAARAIAEKWMEKVDDSTVRVGPVVIARAAILAFIGGLDGTKFDRDALVRALEAQATEDGK